MADSFQAQTAEITRTAEMARAISNALGSGRLEGSLSHGAFGSTRTGDATSDFVRNWSDGREKIRESAERLHKLLIATAEAYESADQEVAQAAAQSVAGTSAGAICQ